MKTFSVQQLCERYQVGQPVILLWIKSGELQAINVSAIRGKKPRWRVTQAAVEAFEIARGSSPVVPPVRRRRKTAQADVIQFYPE